MLKKTIIFAAGMVILVSVVGAALVNTHNNGDDNSNAVDSHKKSEPEKGVLQPEYKPDEIIVKFKESAAEKLEGQLAAGKGAGAVKLSTSLDELGRKYKVTGIKPLVKNFKAGRERTKALLAKNESKGKLNR